MQAMAGVAMAKHERALIINEIAQEDYLDILRLSVLNWGREQAAVYAVYKDALDEAMERLLQFPGMGRPTPELFDGGHRLHVRHHAIYYTFSEREVTVHRILHERRHVTADMLQPEPEDEAI
jgi:plasmid stabilization system protein ParE